MACWPVSRAVARSYLVPTSRFHLDACRSTEFSGASTPAPYSRVYLEKESRLNTRLYSELYGNPPLITFSSIFFDCKQVFLNNKDIKKTYSWKGELKVYMNWDFPVFPNRKQMKQKISPLWVNIGFYPYASSNVKLNDSLKIYFEHTRSWIQSYTQLYF